MIIFLQVICKCNYSCKTLSFEIKKKLFDAYHELGLNEQGSYLLGLVDILPITRRRHGTYEGPESSRRQTTISYRLPDGEGDFVKVCKKTFLNIFAISPQKITNIVKKKKSGDVIYKDNRGGPFKFKFTESDRKLVKSHINSFPRDVGHYSRAKSEKEYLSSDLNMSRLFTSFKEKHPNSNVSQKFYRKVFLKDFPNLSFRRPRVDTCKKCDYLHLQSKLRDCVLANKAKKELELHHRKSEKALSTLKQDTIDSTMPNSNVCSLVIDLQKVFPLPKLVHSDMYYLRQLSCYNFNIHINDTNDAIMCVWHEGQSGRGGNQMASCILQALNTGMLSTMKTSLVIWSDNCAGQIKNRMLIFLYVYLVTIGLFQTIEHKFLVPGHSFSAADRDFAVVEKKAKLSKMQTVQDVEHVIRTARTSRPFKVLRMDKFFDFEEVASKYINTKNLRISQVSCVKIDQNNPGYVLCKQNLNELIDWQQFYVLKKNISLADIASTQLTTLPEEVPLAENKKKDLRNMLDFIDDHNRDFFRQLCDRT